VFGDASLLPLLGRTLVFAFGASSIALLLGGTAAWVTERTASRLSTLVATANLVSLTLPSLLLAIAWISLLAPKSGYINVGLMNLFGLARGPLDIYSLAGMIWVEGLHGAPFAYLLMLPVLRSMDRALEEAAKTSGAGTWKILLRVTIPLTIPAVLSILLFRLVRSLESFEVPALLGLPSGIDVLVSRVYRVVAAERSYGVANAYAIGLMILAILGIYLYSRLTRDSQKFATVTGKGYTASVISLGRWQIAADTFLIVYVLVLLVLPLLTLIWNSFLPYPMAPSGQALSSLVLKNFQTVFSSGKVLLAFQNTFVVATVSAIACIAIAAVVAWIVVRSRVRGRWLLDVLTFLPLTIPGVIMGVAMIWIYLTLPIPIYGTLWILAIAYTTNFLPIAMRFLSPALGQIHRELEEAAYTSGATWWATFSRILLPLLLPAALGAGLYVFMLIFRVLSSTIVIYTPSTIVVPVLIFEMWGEAGGNVVHALLVLNTIVLLPIALLYYWLIRRFGLAGRGA
jgi:iron(III) transport system permease protein